MKKLIIAVLMCLLATPVMALECWGIELGNSIVTGTDSDFSGASNWFAGGAATVTMNYDSGDSGHSTCMRIEAGDGTYEYARLVSIVKPAGLYKVTFDIKYINNDSISPSYCRLYNPANNQAFSTATSWHTVSLYYLLDSNNTEIRLHINYSTGTADNEALVDNFTIKPVLNFTSLSGIGGVGAFIGFNPEYGAEMWDSPQNTFTEPGILGTLVDSGTLTASTLYKIITTEADHFGAGVVVGDYVWAAGVETCDANNTAQPVDISWTPYGTNKMSIEDGALRVDYVDNGNGAFVRLSDANDLSADLVIGQLYRLSCSSKISGGTTKLRVLDGANYYDYQPSLTTNFVTYTFDFIAKATQTQWINFSGLDPGESVYIDNISLKPIDSLANGN